jgi:hypothetical protein
MACQKNTDAPFAGLVPSMYDDPIQGVQDNCSLIAALSSVAWVTQRNKLRCDFDSVSQKYKVFFYGPTVTPLVSNDLDSQNAHSAENEIWVGLYEKAYAQQFCQSPDNPCPLVSIAWPGNASPPLKSLMGCNPTTVITDFYNAIVGICDANKTKYPTVLWTKDPLPTGADGALRGRHSYSVLGFTGDYAILRDPKRVLPTAGNSPNCLLQGTYKFTNNFVASICPGTTHSTDRMGLTVTFGTNGIVGVHKSKMGDNNWFAGMSYVKS